jgi:hypothetical protein
MTARRFCPDCGQPHPVEAQFCGNCGRAFPAADRSATARPRPGRWKKVVGVIALLTVIGVVIAAIAVVFMRSGATPAAFIGDAVSFLDETAMATATPIVEVKVIDSAETPPPPPTPTPTLSAPPTPTTVAVEPELPTVTPTANSVAAPTDSPPLISPDITANRAASPPIIDGSLAEWPSQPSFLAAHQVYAVSEWDGSDDVTAAWQLLWDNDNLYIAVTVTDDIHVQTQTGRDSHRGDSLEIQLDTDRFGDLQAIQVSADDYQITLSPGNFVDLPPSAYRFRGSTSGRIEDAPGHAIAVAAQRTPTGYALEAAIPWSDLSVTPHAGLVLGLALNVNDNDSPGTAVQEIMKSSAPERILVVPSSWGTLTLQSAIDEVESETAPADATVIEGLVHAVQAHNEFGLQIRAGQTVHIDYIAGNWLVQPGMRKSLQKPLFLCRMPLL